MKDINSLEVILRECVDQQDSRAGFEKLVETFAHYMMDSLQVHKTEVAVLLSNSENSFLSFAYPPYLVDAGLIPVSSSEAVAAVIFKRGKPFLENNLLQHKHLSVFENIKSDGKKIQPICKMMGTVIAHEQNRLGVIEISRRGASFSEAGPDFTMEDVDFLKSAVSVLAPFLKAVMPENFKGKLV